MTRPVLTVAGVHLGFGGLKALAGIDLAIDEGVTHAVIGPNGAGKSTLLNVCVGRLAPDQGTVTLGDVVLTGKKSHEISQLGVARVFQTPEIFPDLTLRDNVLVAIHARVVGSFSLDLWNRPDSALVDEAEEILADTGLGKLSQEQAASLSRGDKRRLEIAMCLSRKPRLLLLDEPTAGMSRHDTNSTIDVLMRVKQSGITKIIIEHDMHVVFSLADRVTVMSQGRIIAAGTPAEIRENPDVQEAYLGGAHL